jgi:hypothetical protein
VHEHRQPSTSDTQAGLSEVPLTPQLRFVRVDPTDSGQDLVGPVLVLPHEVIRIDQ